MVFFYFSPYNCALTCCVCVCPYFIFLKQGVLNCTLLICYREPAVCYCSSVVSLFWSIGQSLYCPVIRHNIYNLNDAAVQFFSELDNAAVQ